MYYENAIRKAVQEIRDRQQLHLQLLYAQDPAALRENEHAKLIELCASPEWDAANTIPGVLESVNISRPFTQWAKLKRNLQPLSYVYIDWDSVPFSSEEPTKVSIPVSVAAEEPKKPNAGISIAVAGGTLAAGTVAVVTIVTGGSAVVAVACVLASITGGIVLKKIFDVPNTNPERAGHSSPKPSDAAQCSTADLYRALIRGAYQTNSQRLETWCNQLLSETLTVCQEALQ